MIAHSPPTLRDVDIDQRRQSSNDADHRFSEPVSDVRGLLPSMTLRAVRRSGQLIDFVWASANAAAVTLLRQHPISLRGRSMAELPEVVPPGQPTLFERYRHVLERGKTRSFAHVHWVKGLQEVVIHRVSCDSDLVTVTLTNLNANRRAQASRLRAEKRVEAAAETPEETPPVSIQPRSNA